MAGNSDATGAGCEVAAPLVSDQTALWRDLLYCSTQLSSSLDSILTRDYGISLSEFDVLDNLYGAEEYTLNMSCVQALATVSISGLSRTITRLHAKKLIVKHRSDQDRRALRLELTASGKQTIKAARAAATDFIQRNLGAHFSPAEFAALRASLTKLAAAINAGGCK